MVRLATHTAPDQEPWLKQLLKSTPCLANLSRFGVLISGLFTPPIERGAWSSAMMNRIFGFLAHVAKGAKASRMLNTFFMGRGWVYFRKRGIR